MKRASSGLVMALLLGTCAFGPARAATCPERVDPTAFADEAKLRAWNKVMADAGPRPTASRAHERFIDWLETQLHDIHGLTVTSLPDTIDRWLETGTRLTIGRPGRRGRAVRVSGAVPYSRAATVRGPLTYVPPTTPIADADVAGKVVLRDHLPGATPQAVFFAVADYVHDPDLSMDYTGNYERDFSGYATLLADLEQAAAKGAAGLVFAHTLPHEQVRGAYAPYEGKFWDVTAAYVGVDEGELLKKSEGATVELTVRARRDQNAPTRNLIATLEGGSDERIVIASHTDGMNAIWDNGPISILALAEYFAALPLECRPRDFEFVMSTAHLYLSRNGAHHYAHDVLDPAYDEGTVAFAMALEHLGGKEFLAVQRTDGPGKELRATGASEPFVTFTHESAASAQALISSVIERDLRRTWVLRGADAPQLTFPPHHSYGGEGGAYHGALIPTLAGIEGPWPLFFPNFEMDELVDFELMRRQTMAFGDVALKLQGLPREVIAGADTVYRIGRDATEP